MKTGYLHQRLSTWLLFICAITPSAFAQLSDSKNSDPIDLAQRVNAEQVHDDVEQFRQLAHERWILSRQTRTEIDAALLRVLQEVVEGATQEDLVLGLQKVIAQGIDGHASICDFVGVWNGQATRNGVRDKSKGQLPFLVDLCGERYVAYTHDRSPGKFVNPKRQYRYRLLDDEYPFIESIDDVPINRWIDCARQYVPKGPERAVRWRCVQMLTGLRFFRSQLGLKSSADVRVTLVSEDASKTIRRVLPTADLYQFHLKKPRPKWELIDEGSGSIGYIWLHNGAAPGMESLISGMAQFRDTKGLIIDCRDNVGHGPADTAVFLGAFLLPKETPQTIVGSFARHPDVPGNPLSVHSGMPGLSNTQEQAIRKRESQLSSSGLFSEARLAWSHIMLINPRVSEASWGIFQQPHVRKLMAESVYPYRQPVIILVNHRTFSSGEMFASCLQSLPNVTVVGTSTAASVVGPAMHTLRKSGLNVIFGERLFVTENGKQIDGNGVTPDVTIEIDTDYYRGRRDTTLEKAIWLIREQNSIGGNAQSEETSR